MKKPTRRDILIGMLGASAVGTLTWHFWPEASRLKQVGLASPFSPEQRSAIAAATERVLPGAVAAGVPEYIDYWLAKEPFVDVVLPGFEIGATELDRLARETGDTPFAGLSPADQDALLGRFQRGELEVRNFTGRGFFEYLVRFTLEGMLSHPKYGGNREGRGWKLIGHAHHFWAPPGLGVGAEPEADGE